MFGISGTELFIVALFGLLIFGPDKLPQMGRTAGKFIAEFKRIQQSMEQQIRSEVYGSELPDDLDTTPGRVERTKPVAKPVPAPVFDDEEEEEEE